MKLFIIHRFKDRKKVKVFLKKAGHTMAAKFDLILLDSQDCESWKDQAIEAISNSEAVIVYDRRSCADSENATWEIDKATQSNRPIVYIDPGDTLPDVCSKLKPIYNFETEFSQCFNSGNSENNLELYKLMVQSSESLIQRRQKTNAFFITVIGSLLAIAGLLVNAGTINSGALGLLYAFSTVGLLLCHSWRNLIDNYGKLNKAKFDVILRLEKGFDSQIYAAEWVSLGKGLRPNKYRSFTSTEKNVPFHFMLLIAILTILQTLLHFKDWILNRLIPFFLQFIS